MFGEVAVGVLVLAVLASATSSGLEFMHLHELQKLNPDISTGVHVRKYFYASLTASLLLRASSLLVESLLFADKQCHGYYPVCNFVRSCPHLLFLTTYSILTLYWAQLSYTFTGHSTFVLRKVFIMWNICLYAVCLVIFVLYLLTIVDKHTFTFTYCLAFLITAAMLAWYYVSLTSVLSEIQEDKKMTTRYKEALSRLGPVATVVLSALLALAVYYGLLAFDLLPWKNGYPRHSLLLFDTLLVSLTDLCPSVALMLAMHRRGDANSRLGRYNGHDGSSSRSLSAVSLDMQPMKKTISLDRGGGLTSASRMDPLEQRVLGNPPNTTLLAGKGASPGSTAGNPLLASGRHGAGHPSLPAPQGYGAVGSSAYAPLMPQR
jgi:hypothetical protein